MHVWHNFLTSWTNSWSILVWSQVDASVKVPFMLNWGQIPNPIPKQPHALCRPGMLWITCRGMWVFKFGSNAVGQLCTINTNRAPRRKLLMLVVSVCLKAAYVFKLHRSVGATNVKTMWLARSEILAFNDTSGGRLGLCIITAWLLNTHTVPSQSFVQFPGYLTLYSNDLLKRFAKYALWPKYQEKSKCTYWKGALRFLECNKPQTKNISMMHIFRKYYTTLQRCTMYARNIHFPLWQSTSNMSKTQCRSLKTGKMHRASLFGSVYTLFCYRGLEEGETGLGCIVREERVGGGKSREIRG